MSEQSLEERVAALEQRVAELSAALANGAPKNDWRSTLGLFAGDEVMKRICDYALEYRERDREKARRRRNPNERKKK
jgi:hypothetical protein